jgi:hypothetical protein
MNVKIEHGIMDSKIFFITHFHTFFLLSKFTFVSDDQHDQHAMKKFKI